MLEHNSKALTIATRESPLALWQARFIRQCLQQRWPELQVELLGMTTSGDQILDSPLAKVGGKGLFVKELEAALLDGRADIAVHSTKDMPAELPPGLELFIAGERADPRDALVLPAGSSLATAQPGLDALVPGAVVGTSSLRRLCQLKHLRPDLDCRDLRGNVNTRLAKLDAGDYDAIVLAAAGLQRLGLAQRISALLPVEQVLPAVAQGALAIEYRHGDEASWLRFADLCDPLTALCVSAERALNRQLEGGCQVPIAAHAVYQHGELTLQGRVGSPDGKRLLSANDSIKIGLAKNLAEQDVLDASVAKASELGISVAHELLAAGASELLVAVR